MRKSTRRPPWDRFVRFVAESELGGCWYWTGGTDEKGYARMWTGDRQERVTRWLWRSFHGPLADGICVLHACDNPTCVRLSHLFAGTQLDNIADREAKGRGAWRRTATCKRGHPWTAESTGADSRGHRSCLTCRKERRHLRWASHRT